MPGKVKAANDFWLHILLYLIGERKEKTNKKLENSSVKVRKHANHSIRGLFSFSTSPSTISSCSLGNKTHLFLPLATLSFTSVLYFRYLLQHPTILLFYYVGALSKSSRLIRNARRF